jgi:hypothetical protein
MGTCNNPEMQEKRMIISRVYMTTPTFTETCPHFAADFLVNLHFELAGYTR